MPSNSDEDINEAYKDLMDKNNVQFWIFKTTNPDKYKRIFENINELQREKLIKRQAAAKARSKKMSKGIRKERARRKIQQNKDKQTAEMTGPRFQKQILKKQKQKIKNRYEMPDDEEKSYRAPNHRLRSSNLQSRLINLAQKELKTQQLEEKKKADKTAAKKARARNATFADKTASKKARAALLKAEQAQKKVIGKLEPNRCRPRATPLLTNILAREYQLVKKKTNLEVMEEFKEAEKEWNELCIEIKTSGLSSSIEINEMENLSKLLLYDDEKENIDRQDRPNYNSVQDMRKACDFWLKAFTGTLTTILDSNFFSNIRSLDINTKNIDRYYSEGQFNWAPGSVNSGELEDTSNLTQNEISRDVIQKILSHDLIIGKGGFSIIPSKRDINYGGVIYKKYSENYPYKFRHFTAMAGEMSERALQQSNLTNWDSIDGLRDDEKETASNVDYWIINDQRGRNRRQPIHDINETNYEGLLRAGPRVFRNRPELYLRYLVKHYQNKTESSQLEYRTGICAFINVRLPITGRDDPIYDLHNPVLRLVPSSDIINTENRWFPNHSNIIFFTPVRGVGVGGRLRLQCSYYDPNTKIQLYIKALVEQMINNLRTKVRDENIRIEDEIHWISPDDITDTITLHGIFSYTKKGLCGEVSRLFALLWGKYGIFFKNPRHMYRHLSRSLNWSIATHGLEMQEYIMKNIRRNPPNIVGPRDQDQKYKVLIPMFKAFLGRNMLISTKLIKMKITQRYAKAYFSRIIKKEEQYKDGKRIGGGKKVRKHQGIVQTGGNTGKLRKGYRYSGKKLKSGLPQIIKCKSKKC